MPCSFVVETWRTTAPGTPERVAVTFTAPAATPVASPCAPVAFETVATTVAWEVQVASAVTSREVPSR